MHRTNTHLDFRTLDATTFLHGGLIREPHDPWSDTGLEAPTDMPTAPSVARQALARGLATVSRARAAAGRRVDRRSAGDLAPAK